jgi:hypothetical protein
MAAMAILQVSCAHPQAGRSRAAEFFSPFHPSENHPEEGLAAKPWGRLDYLKFSLEQPDEYLPDSSRTLQTWFFEGYSERQLADLFNSVEVTDSQRSLLLDSAKWKRAANGIAVTPDRDVVFGLNRPARQRIYGVLAESELNFAYRYPYRFRMDGFEDWFSNSGLSAEKLEIIRELTYTNGPSLCLVDVDQVQRRFTPEEFNGLFRSLYSEPSLMMRLRVSSPSDVDALIKYWGKGGQGRRIQPLLKSLATVPGGSAINISYLLPPFPRLRLYTFAPHTENAAVTNQDCFWSAMNFFNEKPDARLANFDYALRMLSTAYYETQEERTYGDMIVLLDSNQKTLHACVYLADDVVFTRNGADHLQPWVLMKMPDVLAHYASDKPLRAITLRPKNI